MKKPNNYQMYRKKLLPKRYFSIILVLVIFVVGLTLLLRKIVHTYSSASSLVSFTATDSIRKIDLPDSSMILLYPGSEIIIDRKSNPKHPKIILTGDASFLNQNKINFPMVVYAGNGKIESYNAGFTVHQDSVNLGIKVRKGQLNFSITVDSSKHFILTKNQFLTYKFGNPLSLLNPAISNLPNDTLIFSHTPLPEVLLSIGTSYELTLRIKGNSLPYHDISGDFHLLKPDVSIQLMNEICPDIDLGINNKDLLVTKKS